MAIAHAHTDTQNSVAAPATLTVTMPTGAISTDIAICVINSGAGVAVGSYTAPAGWTLIGQVLDANTGADHISTQAWWSLGNNASLSFTKSGSVVDLGWVIGCFSGCDTTTPIDATGTANSDVAGATSLTTNAVTVATDQAWHLIGFGDWNSGTYSATGFTVSASATTHEEAALLYNTTPKSTGSTGTVVVSDTASGTGQVLIGVPFALRPAAGGGGTTYAVWLLKV